MNQNKVMVEYILSNILENKINKLVELIPY